MGVYIAKFGKNFSKIFSYWDPIPLLLYQWGEIWHGGVDLHAKFDTHRCNVSPLRGKKPQNRPLSNLRDRHLALDAMLPVTSSKKGDTTNTMLIL